MNNYPEWWNTTITIYNKYTDAETRQITWYAHTVDNCFWQYVKDKLSVGETVLETTFTKCRIPKNTLFKEKYEWINLEDKSKYFTLGIGDIILKGNSNIQINEYEKGHRSSDIISQYKELQGCIVIDTVSIDVGAGRCNEHYYVRGN